MSNIRTYLRLGILQNPTKKKVDPDPTEPRQKKLPILPILPILNAKNGYRSYRSHAEAADQAQKPRSLGSRNSGVLEKVLLTSLSYPGLQGPSCLSVPKLWLPKKRTEQKLDKTKSTQPRQAEKVLIGQKDTFCYTRPAKTSLCEEKRPEPASESGQTTVF